MNMKALLKTPAVLTVFILSIALSSVSCEDKKSRNSVNTSKKSEQQDSIVEIPVQKVEPPIVIHYKIDSLNTSVELDSFKNRYSEAQQKVIYALNRIDPRRVRVGENLVIPDTLFDDIFNYAPFPKNLKLLSDIPKTVLISQRVQGIALYENGELIKWGPVSSGKKSTPTPNGLHYGNYKAREKVSTVDEGWILPFYFNFMNLEGVGVHQYLLPGYPASHACVRLNLTEAEFLYDWAQQWELTSNGKYLHKNGTPFMVYGEYDYDAPAPWLQLAANNKSNEILESELRTLENYKAAYDADEKNKRDFREKEENGLIAMNSKIK
jgi:lipoprotein-anchoring transpeptidase ErfK/SrfK